MKGFISLPLLVIVIIITLVGGGWYYSVSQTSNPQPASSKEDENIANADVTITKNGFVPVTIKVKRNTQITWTNQDTDNHQVASDPHPTHTGLPDFDSLEPLKQNDSYSFIFENTGSFTYHDHLNPLVKGTVVVE